MSLLRIYASLMDQPQHCQWALLGDRGEPVSGAGRPADLPQRAARVQLVIPAAQVLLTRARIPRAARRGNSSVMAFAVEERTAGDPDASQVSWLGTVGDADALAVADKPGLARWREALGAAGIRVDEVHCETLLLPIQAGEWSMAWNGREGFVRSGTFEGAATDCGGPGSPPLSLRLMLEEAQARGAEPAAIALYVTTPDAAPDFAAWRRELGVALRPAGAWDWRTAPPDAGIGLAQQGQRWRMFSGLSARLRPAAWMLAAALALHAVALAGDWALLVVEQRELRQQMEAQFRASFPEAIAVVDPALQMRRKLAEARHSAGQADSGDFLPLVVRVAAATQGTPPGTVQAMSYQGAQMTLEIASGDDVVVQRIKSRLVQAGLNVDTSAAPTRGGRAVVHMTVRPL
jgi:general secretion pathway protein L